MIGTYIDVIVYRETDLKPNEPTTWLTPYDYTYHE